LRLAPDPQAGFVHVLDGRLGHLLAQDIDEGLTAFGVILADARDGRGGQAYTEEVGHQRGQAFLGQQLVVLQVEHAPRDAGAVLCRGGDTLGEDRLRLSAAARATACVGAMFGDEQGGGLGKVEHLPGGMLRGHGLVQGLTAACAGLGEMVEGRVGRCGPAQRLARVAWLSAGLLARLLA
jgi:hypothetical protein